MLRLAAAMDAVPSAYFQYYYFEREVLAELQAKGTTRAEDILSWLPDYWRHYEEQATKDDPRLGPSRSRGGIDELEFAIECMGAVFDDTGDTLPVNVLNQASVPGFPDSLVVETLGHCDREGVHPLPMPGLPSHLQGLVEALAFYQQAAADAAWSGARGTPSRRCRRIRSCGRSTSRSTCTRRWPRRTARRCRSALCPPDPCAPRPGDAGAIP